MENAKRLAIGTICGAVTLSAIGYAIFGLALPGFYADFMNAGSATGVEREPVLLWAVALGMLSYGALMTLAIGSRPGLVKVTGGMTMGAIVSFLLWFTADLMLYGISNVGDLTGVLIDPLLKLVPGAAAGGVITFVVGKIPVASQKGDTGALTAGRAA